MNQASSDESISSVGGVVLVTSAAAVEDTSNRIEDEEYQVDREISDVVLDCMWQLAKKELVVKTRLAITR